MNNNKINIISVDHVDFLWNKKVPYLTFAEIHISSDICAVYIQLSENVDEPKWTYFDEWIDRDMTMEELMKEIDWINDPA